MKKTTTALMCIITAILFTACSGEKSEKQPVNEEIEAIKIETGIDVKEEITDTSKGWPDNEFTKSLPKPNAGEVIESISGDMKVGSFDGKGCRIDVTWTIDDAKAYTKQAKDAGFTVNASEDTFGDTYIFSAENKDGVQISVMNQGIIILIEK